MKQIKLTQDQYAIVDDADYDWLNQHKWHAKKDRNRKFYAARTSPWKDSKHFTIRMAREILGLKRGDPRQADHKNRRTLDNRLCNLRICTRRENTRNRGGNSNTISYFKGVDKDKRGKNWRARIGYRGNRISLGIFPTKKQAALAYNTAAKKYFGEFACLNPI